MGWWKAKGVIYKPIDEIDLDGRSDQFYISPDVKAPRMAGLLVKIFAWVLELRFLGTFLLYFLKRNNLINKLVTDAWLEESPIYVPSYPFQDLGQQEVRHIECYSSPTERVQGAVDCLPWGTRKDNPNLGFCHWTIIDYSRAYSSGETTPITVAERFIAAVQDSSGPELQMSFFINCDADDILKQAKNSTHRYQRGEPISVLDGILVAVKDEIDCLPYPTTGGTKWLHEFRDCKKDARCVERLRECGAILVGKTNMHELGAGTSGINPHYGTTRNPYNRGRISGGSSSGSAAVVAAGLCPVALGVDGGGSVRLPAALCGVVGFKPTFGCIPHSGVLPLNWTVGMVGVLATTIEDAFIVYAAISGHLISEELPTSPVKPKLCFPILNSMSRVTNITLAKYEEWFDDCSNDIKIQCSEALAQLCSNYKWKTLEVTIPDIEAMRLAHYLTIGSECTAALSSYLEKLNYSELGWDVRVALSIYGAFSGKDYIKAQKLRNRLIQIHKKIFSRADVIVVPTSGVTAYPILADALQTGELDYVNGAAMVRYQISGNFLGLPAVTVPVGYDKDGLPIGIQFIGKPWSEATLIHIAYAMQALCIQDCRKPAVYYDLLHEN